MPLTRAVDFKATLQKGNRFQVPRVVRWEFRLEPTQVLRVTVDCVGSYSQKEFFFVRMNKDGRITIPKLTLNLLQRRYGRQSLVGYVFELKVEPSGSGNL